MSEKQIPYEIVYTPPAVFDRAKELWNIKWDGNIVMVYGNKIHQSFRHPMDPDLLVHELVHVRQHAEYPGGPEKWWDKYFEDVDFRISQELDAYRTQYQWCIENYNGKTRKAVLDHCAKSLSSKLYGNVMTYNQAFELIKSI